MKELAKIIDKFFQKDGQAIIYYDLDQALFNDVVNNIKEYEKPDMISVFDNIILGIEHFEFDSFDNGGKGSDFKIKDASNEREIQTKIDRGLKEKDSVVIHNQIISSASLKNYFDNFKKTFDTHYQKIDSYIDHIKEDFDCNGKEIVICFFGEDVSPLGSYFLDKNKKINLLNPLYSEDIVCLLEKSTKIKYLIIGVYAMNEYKLIIIKNNKATLNKFKKENQKISESDFLSFSPKTTGFAVKISDNS